MLSDTALIQANFNKSATTYSHHAQIQRIAALKLMAQLNKHHDNGLILDLGCGPGTFIYKNEELCINLDLSLSMLKINPNSYKICSNAHALPFKKNSFRVVVSNLMVQWSYNHILLFREINRTLDNYGKFMFTTLISPSLFELQQAWRYIDGHQHTIPFLNKAAYFAALMQSNFILHESHTWENTIYFPSVSELVKHFKKTGTSLPKSLRHKGLCGPKILAQLENAYEVQRTCQGLPLTYVYLLVIASKDHFL